VGLCQFAKYIGPVIGAIRELGGSGRPDEVPGVIARDLKMSDAEQSETLPSGVQTRHVRDFRGAMTGRVDKGIIITTGSFTSDARSDERRRHSARRLCCRVAADVGVTRWTSE